MMRKDTDKALELADKAVAAAPKDARGYLLRGTIRQALPKHTEAVADFTKCIELDPRKRRRLQSPRRRAVQTRTHQEIAGRLRSLPGTGAEGCA